MATVVRLHAKGGPEQLRVESEEVPAPGSGQVLLRQEAIGVNFVDTYFRDGTFPMVTPAVLGVEGAGVVEAIGPDVTSVRVGDRVGYYFALGAYASSRLVYAADLVPLPDDIGAVDAAALLAKGITAWGRLRRAYPVGPDTVVLVTGATGGVGSLLATWAQHLGATVIALVAGPDRVETARKLGLEHVVAAGELAALGREVDVVFDLVGQATFAEALSALRDGGAIDVIGAASGEPVIDEAELERRRIRVSRGPSAQYVPDRATLLAAAAEVFEAWRAGVFGEREVRTYPLAEVAQAHRDLEGRGRGAAIVLVPDERRA